MGVSRPASVTQILRPLQKDPYRQSDPDAIPISWCRTRYQSTYKQNEVDFENAGSAPNYAGQGPLCKTMACGACAKAKARSKAALEAVAQQRLSKNKTS